MTTIIKNSSRLSESAFQNAADHLREEVLEKLRKSAESTGRRDLFEVYEEARKLFVKFLKERRFDLALKLEAGYRPH